MMRHVITVLTVSLFGVCLAWLCFVQGLYLVKLDEGIGEEWHRYFTSGTAGLWLLGHFLVLPVGLASGLRLVWHRYRRRFGVIAGVVVAFWCNTVFLAVPYLGAWPNMITGLLRIVIPGDFLPTMVANLLLWPIVTRFVFKAR